MSSDVIPSVARSQTVKQGSSELFGCTAEGRGINQSISDWLIITKHFRYRAPLLTRYESSGIRKLNYGLQSPNGKVEKVDQGNVLGKENHCGLFPQA